MIDIKREYEQIVSEYIIRFAKKHDLEFDYWVADRFGEVAVFGDYFLNFSDIRFDIDNEIPKGEILDWYNESIDKALEEKDFPNFENWIKINTTTERVAK